MLAGSCLSIMQKSNFIFNFSLIKLLIGKLALAALKLTYIYHHAQPGLSGALFSGADEAKPNPAPEKKRERRTDKLPQKMY